MTTPERALDMVALRRLISDLHGEASSSVPSSDLADALFRLTISEIEKIEAVLNHYAEIMQAEPAFTVRLWSYKQDANMQNFDFDQPKALPDGRYELIIKPKPLP